MLSERVRTRIEPKKGGPDAWLEVHREAHRRGFKSTATMMYGHVEEVDDVLDHFDAIRALQDEFGGFTAFVPWSFKPNNTLLEKWIKQHKGPNAYLRMLAASRLYLDNFPHVQASWFSEGKKAGQIALHFGADDWGGTLFEENVHKAAAYVNTITVDEIVTLIREAGFTPAQRNTEYEILRYRTRRRPSGGIDGDQLLPVRVRVEPRQRLQPLVAEPDRVVVDVHQHEARRRLLVDAPAVAHGVFDRLVDVGVRPGNGVAEALRELPVHGVAEITAHHVHAERERQAGLALPDFPEVHHLHQPHRLVRDLPLVNEEAEVRLAVQHRLRDLVERDLDQRRLLGHEHPQQQRRGGVAAGNGDDLARDVLRIDRRRARRGSGRSPSPSTRRDPSSGSGRRRARRWPRTPR